MLNFTLLTPQDRKEAAAIERRRAIEQERKKRIFNPKQRLFGIDYSALETQIGEKNKAKQEELQKDLQYIQLQTNYTETVKALEVKEKEERRRIAEEINNFRLNYQKPEDRREFDLNDPNGYKRAIPARLYDDDPRCGPSSIQKFEGEDLDSKERSELQRQQIKAWLDQQMEEKEAAEKERIAAEDAYKAAVMARDQRAIELDMLEKECRKRLDFACCKYNKALADEREARNIERQRKEQADCDAQSYNVMTSDMMTENPDVSISNLGPQRRIGYMYKGMDPAERAEVRLSQLAQIEEARQRKNNEKRFDQEWQEYNEGVQKSIATMDKDLARKQREFEKNIMQENLRMGKEHKNHKEFLNKIVYTNKPTAAYYDQFNTSTR